jgi:CRP/FNR family transcriptional regulator
VSIKEALSVSRLFSSLPAGDIERLAQIASGRNIEKDELIFSEGEEAGGFYLLEEGKVKIHKLSPSGKEQILRIVNPGGIFGEAPVFSGGSYPAFARGLAQSRIIFFPADRFRAEIRANPELALHMLGAISQQLRRFASLVEQLTLRTVKARLAEYLLGAPADSGGGIWLDITKRELSLHLGTQPETLSRALSTLQSEGLLEIEGPNIRILDADQLERIAGGEQ